MYSNLMYTSEQTRGGIRTTNFKNKSREYKGKI